MAEFDRHAESYDTLLDRGVALSGESGAYFSAYKADYLARLEGVGAAPRVLDYGCGVGNLSRALRERLPDAMVHGYDPSAASLTRIPEDLRTAGRFTADEADLDEDYDLAVISNVLHHVVPEQRQALLAGLSRRLRAGGRLVVIEHNPLNPLTRRVVATCALDRDAVLLPAAESVGHLKRLGLRDVRREFIVFFPRSLAALRPLEPLLGWLPLGAQYVAMGSR